MLGVMLTLTACLTTNTTVTDVSCLAFKPITFSGSKDTQQTIKEVREHNAAWDELCG